MSSPFLPVKKHGISLDYKFQYLTVALVLVLLLGLGVTWQRPCKEEGSSSTSYRVLSLGGAAAQNITQTASLAAAAAAAAGGPTPTPAAGTKQKQDASIVVVVTTKASSKDRRDWLRKQFRRNVELLRQKDRAAADAVVFKFALGSQGLSDKGRNWTQAEQQEHGDLLMLDIIDVNTPDPPPDGVETATALKVVHSAIWAVENYNFPWFVRLGDDSYFRVDHFLLNVAGTLSKTKLVFGYAEDPQLGWSFSHGVSIKRYCSGMGFFMTHDVTKYVADNAPVLYKGYPEDAVVGLWLAGTSFKVQHDMRLHDWVWKRCSNESIIIHKHDYGVVPEDGVMRSCFPDEQKPKP